MLVDAVQLEMSAALSWRSSQVNIYRASPVHYPLQGFQVDALDHCYRGYPGACSPYHNNGCTSFISIHSHRLS